METRTYTAKWGDEIELDLEYHTSYITVKPDGEEYGTTVSMNNKYLLEMAMDIIKRLG